MYSIAKTLPELLADKHTITIKAGGKKFEGAFQGPAFVVDTMDEKIIQPDGEYFSLVHDEQKAFTELTRIVSRRHDHPVVVFGGVQMTYRPHPHEKVLKHLGAHWSKHLLTTASAIALLAATSILINVKQPVWLTHLF